MSKETDWRNTKWDVRKWTEEQKIKFQEECFNFGYNWTGRMQVKNIDATAYHINSDGRLWFWEQDDIINFYSPDYGIEKKWEDMFTYSKPSNKPNSPWHDMPTLVKILKLTLLAFVSMVLPILTHDFLDCGLITPSRAIWICYSVGTLVGTFLVR